MKEETPVGVKVPPSKQLPLPVHRLNSDVPMNRGKVVERAQKLQRLAESQTAE